MSKENNLFYIPIITYLKYRVGNYVMIYKITIKTLHLVIFWIVESKIMFICTLTFIIILLYLFLHKEIDNLTNHTKERPRLSNKGFCLEDDHIHYVGLLLTNDRWIDNKQCKDTYFIDYIWDRLSGGSNAIGGNSSLIMIIMFKLY